MEIGVFLVRSRITRGAAFGAGALARRRKPSAAYSQHLRTNVDSIRQRYIVTLFLQVDTAKATRIKEVATAEDLKIEGCRERKGGESERFQAVSFVY
jgi:hypothetical protein